MPSFRTLEAWISVNGRRLSEYNVQEKNHGRGVGWTVITCWVPSELGQVSHFLALTVRYRFDLNSNVHQELKIHFKDSREGHNRPPTSWIPKIDGSPLEGAVIHSGVRYPPSSNDTVVKDIPTSTGRKTLMFSSVIPAGRFPASLCSAKGC
jgi:hypothetical protein